MKDDKIFPIITVFSILYAAIFAGLLFRAGMLVFLISWEMVFVLMVLMILFICGLCICVWFEDMCEKFIIRKTKEKIIIRNWHLILIISISPIPAILALLIFIIKSIAIAIVWLIKKAGKLIKWFSQEA